MRGGLWASEWIGRVPYQRGMAGLPDWMRTEPQMVAKKRPDGDGTPDKTE